MLAVVVGSQHVSFEEIADQRQLSSARARLGELRWDVEPEATQRRKFLADITVDGITYLMTRRALEPVLVNHLFDRLADRPLERALVAWDVARGCLFGKNDAELAQRVVTEMVPLKHLGPPATVAVPRERLAAFIEAIRSSSDTSRVRDDFATMPSLAGILALSANDQPDAITAINAYAKQLAYAHLPSLALAFLQLAWERFAPQSTLDLMLDIGLDHGMVGAFPVQAGTDDRSVQQQAYVALRASSYEYDIVTGERMLEVLDKLPAIHGSKEPTLVLARAELAILQNQAVDTASKQIIEAVGTSRSRHATEGWRYAEFVKGVVGIHMGGNPLLEVMTFTSTFGNNARLWGHAAHRADARADLLELLSREVRFASHDPEVWRAVSILVTDGLDIDTELGGRLLSQFLAAYA